MTPGNGYNGNQMVQYDLENFSVTSLIATFPSVRLSERNESIKGVHGE